MLILDNEMRQYMDRLAPETGVFDLTSARKVSANILIPAPLVSTMAAYMQEGDELYLK